MAKKKLKGTIKRIGVNHTVAVEVVRVFHHPRYRKRIRTSKVYLAHAEGGEWKVGDRVTIEESRPISARKHFRVIVEEKAVSRKEPKK
ncbi:MAG: 30S ribosomal protein S17 [Patescibacteria group bacterium]